MTRRRCSTWRWWAGRRPGREFAGQTAHTLMAQISLAGGVLVDKLAVLQPGAAETWELLREPGEVPMPAVE